MGRAFESHRIFKALKVAYQEMKDGGKAASVECSITCKGYRGHDVETGYVRVHRTEKLSEKIIQTTVR